jgi:hypothetical protein
MATTQNTSVVIRDTTIGTSIKPALVDELWQLSRVTGGSLSGTLNRAIEQWLAIEGPVYMKHYAERGQQA